MYGLWNENRPLWRRKGTTPLIEALLDRVLITENLSFKMDSMPCCKCDFQLQMFILTIYDSNFDKQLNSNKSLYGLITEKFSDYRCIFTDGSLDPIEGSCGIGISFATRLQYSYIQKSLRDDK